MVLEVDGVKFETAPWDPRFPNTNQTKHCYQSYLDFNRCTRIRGKDFDACKYYQRVYKSICPNSWIDKWDTQIQENRFPGNI